VRNLLAYDRPSLARQQWLLLSGKENLEQRHKLLLARLMRLNLPLYRAYLLKEQLHLMLHHPWLYMGALRRNLEASYQSAVRSRLPEMANVAKRLRPYFDNVIAGFMHGIKLGLVEAINGNVARPRAAAHGFSDREYFKLKIFQRCSLPHNPVGQDGSVIRVLTGFREEPSFFRPRADGDPRRQSWLLLQPCSKRATTSSPTACRTDTLALTTSIDAITRSSPNELLRRLEDVGVWWM
jgi:hypothetical protein